MTAQTAGVPLKIPFSNNSYGTNSALFLPGAFTLGDILEREGYNQMLLIGSDAEFGGRRQLLPSTGIMIFGITIPPSWMEKLPRIIMSGGAMRMRSSLNTPRNSFLRWPPRPSLSILPC